MADVGNLIITCTSVKLKFYNLINVLHKTVKIFIHLFRSFILSDLFVFCPETEIDRVSLFFLLVDGKQIGSSGLDWLIRSNLIFAKGYVSFVGIDSALCICYSSYCRSYYLCNSEFENFVLVSFFPILLRRTDFIHLSFLNIAISMSEFLFLILLPFSFWKA